MHTPTPWYASADGNGGEHIQSAAINEDNYVARVDAMDEQGHANVDLIIKAVNNHDALVAEATELLKNTTWDEDSVGYARVLTQDIEALKAALEQVK